MTLLQQENIFLHTGQGFPRFSPVPTNFILQMYIPLSDPWGRKKKKKTNSNTCSSIHWLYRRSCNSVVKTFGVEVIATSHTTSTFSMTDVNMTR